MWWLIKQSKTLFKSRKRNKIKKHTFIFNYGVVGVNKGTQDTFLNLKKVIKGDIAKKCPGSLYYPLLNFRVDNESTESSMD